MPVRNVVRYATSQTYYHVYNRGHNKELLFYDLSDYQFFASLLQRCFGPVQIKSTEGKLYPWFGDNVSIHAFCLMPNHFHLLLFQKDSEQAISKAMQSLATTYSLYFNKKYGKRGSVFESKYKASPVLQDTYLQHITRYIHLNPKDYKTWPHSSYQTYRGSNQYRWVKTESILELFDGLADYQAFEEDYEELKEEIPELKYELADHATTFS